MSWMIGTEIGLDMDNNERHTVLAVVSIWRVSDGEVDRVEQIDHVDVSSLEQLIPRFEHFQQIG